MSICACEQSVNRQFNDLLSTLESIREKCPVIKELLVPDHRWERFKEFELGKRDEALHASNLIVALLNGNLARITQPIHKFLFDEGKMKSEVVEQYRQDLQEHWMFKRDRLARHRRAKSFAGRIVELQIAEWFQNQGWTITGLAALGCNTDIECVRPIGLPSSIEVKFIGQSDEEFQQVVNSLGGRPAGPLGLSDSACSYLVFRVYEAATQLKTSNCRHIAVVVIDAITYTSLRVPLRQNWINWESPTFLESSPAWTSFMVGKHERYPTIESDLAETINTLHELWIVVRGNGYQYHLKAHYLF